MKNNLIQLELQNNLAILFMNNPPNNLINNKFWPSVTRIDEAFGDRNLICTCAPIEDYIES